VQVWGICRSTGIIDTCKGTGIEAKSSYNEASSSFKHNKFE